MSKKTKIIEEEEKIKEIKRLPRFEGSHCPNESNHEYIVRKDGGKYVRIKDVLEIISSRGRMDE